MNTFYFGTDYYPEHWPEERWEKDAYLMKEAGINVVRLAEFAWAKLEPAEGEYDFTWLNKAINILSKFDIKVVLCTVTATPPRWLVKKYPNIFPEDKFGHQKGFGSRRHYCLNNKIYHKYSETITQILGDYYKENPNVIGWQIDNEFGCHDTTRCYCDNCLSEWQLWLKNKYGTIENLNESWGTVFWSQTFSQWDEVHLPRHTVASHNPSLLLDFYRFSSDSNINFQRGQVEILREIEPKWFITHNFMGLFSEIDYYKMGADLDFISWDNYPGLEKNINPTKVAFAHDIMEGTKEQNYWVMEQQSGAAGWEKFFGRTPKPGQLRLWTYQSVGHGADGIVYFRWRTCRFGTEQYWHGILDHDGIPRRRYEEIQRTGKDLQALSTSLSGSKKSSEVAIIYSYDNYWAFDIQPHNDPKNEDFWGKNPYRDLVFRFYQALYDQNIPVSIVSPESDLSRFKVVIAPSVFVSNDTIENNLRNYVNNGGVLVTTYRTGVKDWNNVVVNQPLPGRLADVLGIEIKDYDSLVDGASIQTTGLMAPFNSIKGEVHYWVDVIEAKEARVVATYQEDYFKDEAFITVNQYGTGQAYYFGSLPESELLIQYLSSILNLAGVAQYIQAPEHVELVVREKENDKFLFVLNHNSHEVEVVFKTGVQELLSEDSSTTLRLPGYEVKVYKINNQNIIDSLSSQQSVNILTY